ncbi:MAG: hypothetical protein KAI53_00300 [Candidatus Aenigmarchaeota archaeon]|nr:hypothetical protein [Candidatus Aenigmarchaeota archaeon]
MGFFGFRSDREELERLKKRGDYLESKVKLLTELLSDIDSEIDVLQFDQPKQKVPSDVNQADTELETGKRKSLSHEKIVVDMRGGIDEKKMLSGGWWPPENNFRWTGRDSTPAEITFDVSPKAAYKLYVSFFVPRMIAKKPISVLAYGKKIFEFTPTKESTVEKTIQIPNSLTDRGILKLSITSSFWCPGKIDKSLKDGRILSLAFKHIELERI